MEHQGGSVDGRLKGDRLYRKKSKGCQMKWVDGSVHPRDLGSNERWL